LGEKRARARKHQRRGEGKRGESREGKVESQEGEIKEPGTSVNYWSWGVNERGENREPQNRKRGFY